MSTSARKAPTRREWLVIAAVVGLACLCAAALDLGVPGARDDAEPKVRSRAAQMGFSGEMADTKVGSLSGGERARLLIGLACFHGPHLLILDEPTNHLDIEARAALIQALGRTELTPAPWWREREERVG